jgi:uncharacterized membrane protein YraQ (UPF0718 family)
MKGTWETTEGGGSGLGMVLVIIVAAALLGPAVAAAVAELLHLLVLVLVAVAALGAACLAGLLAFGARRRLEDAARAEPPNLGAVSPLHTARAAHQLPQPRPAIEAPRQVHIHLHGVTPEDVAELVRRHSEQE